MTFQGKYVKTKWLAQHQPCPCGKSSDAYAISETGGYCFVCKTKFPHEIIGKDSAGHEKPSSGDTAGLPITEIASLQRLPYRAHTNQALEKYGILAEVDATGDIIGIRYPGWVDGSYKRRDMRKKGFRWINHPGPGLIGKDRFSAGSSSAVVVTEGEEDMLSAYEMLEFKIPVVSVQSSGNAKADCMADADWLNSFDKIYLDFDTDEPGQKAIADVGAMFPYKKIFIINKTKWKDANEYHVNGDAKDYRTLFWTAKRQESESVISSLDDLQLEFMKPPKHAIATFPWKDLQEATLGIRAGETYLVKAMEGIGKTEFLGAIEYHVLTTTDLPIGVIHLEEQLQRSALRMVNYKTHIPVHLEGRSPYTMEQHFEIFKDIVKTDQRMHFYKKGKNDENTDHFLNSIRFMVASAGCKVVFFDHISRLATSFRLDDERKELDYVSTKLSEMAEELDFALVMISHVNAEGETRGSKNISKEAWTVINLYRNRVETDPILRNTTTLEIEKNRHASTTGPAGALYFDPKTFVITDTIPRYGLEHGEDT